MTDPRRSLVAALTLLPVLIGCGSSTEVLESGSGGAGGGATQGSTAAQGGATSSASTGGQACASDATCIDDNGGLPFLCREGACASVLSEDCPRVIGDLEAIREGTAIVVGALAPLTGSEAATGEAQALALELADDDLREATGGVPGADGERRTLAVVLCDEVVDVERAASHLVDDLGVALVIGPSGGARAITAAASAPAALFLSPSGDEPALDTLADQGLVWQAESVAAHGDAAAAVVARLEPSLAGPPARMAVLFAEDARGAAVSDRFLAALVLNGASAAANVEAGNLLVVSVAGSDLAPPAAAVVDFQPDLVVVLSPGLGPLVEAIEDAESEPTWTPPVWVSAPPLADVDALAADLSGRLFAIPVGPPADRALFEELSVRYQTAVGARPPLAAVETYDTAYVALAALASAGDPAAGAQQLASGVARVLPPGGLEVRVGPLELNQMFSVLATGGTVDLRGATGSLDADPTTGSFPRSHQVLCAPQGALIESGLTVGEAGQLEGDATCL